MGKPLPIVENCANNTLNKNPSVCCGNGIIGCKNMGNFSSSPYINSKNVLYGLLALNVPVKINVKFMHSKKYAILIPLKNSFEQ